MNIIYSFLIGPMAWISFSILIIGFIIKILYFFFLSKNKDPEVLRYYHIGYAFRSIVAWNILFLAKSWRQNIPFTIATILFHISIFLIPIFLTAHVILIRMSWGISYFTLSETISDIFTVVGLISAAYLFIRRIIDKKIRYISTFQDYFLICLCFLVLFTGFVSYHQFINYKFFICTHILLSELLIILIPITKLSHIIFAPILRGYIGSEFGRIRNVYDW